MTAASVGSVVKCSANCFKSLWSAIEESELPITCVWYVLEFGLVTIWNCSSVDTGVIGSRTGSLLTGCGRFLCLASSFDCLLILDDERSPETEADDE
ncbi:hypothetical protein OGATHE_000267 [Ogataea polymorpha]|uniref:Uncharacterized protein n=1 Tax=Ogataea polymorpha TaxID=460523 RepID=A0A9P8PW61_9ASCO|nr:hypothetical protein OGATHE_000267 [Ogataea polymorpha]